MIQAARIKTAQAIKPIAGLMRIHSPMSVIKVCDTVPYVDLYGNTPQEVINIRDLCGGRRIVLVGLPAAFSPVCTSKHLPGYISRAHELKCLGVDEIVCVSVNDPYVMTAWGKHLNAQGKVTMLADTNACFTLSLGLGIDIPDLGGIRSKRYSMVLQNCMIQTLNIEPDGTGLTVSAAECIQV